MKRVERTVVEILLYDDAGNLIKESRTEKTETTYEVEAAPPVLIKEKEQEVTPIEEPKPKKVINKPVRREREEVVPVKEVVPASAALSKSFLERFQQRMSAKPIEENLIKEEAPVEEKLNKVTADDLACVAYEELDLAGIL